MTGTNITGITGTITDSDIASGHFDITGLSGFASADNQFNPTAPYVDFSGISFSTGTHGDFNFADAGGGNLVLVSSILNPGGTLDGPVTELSRVEVTATSAVPEPANAAFLLAGLGMMGVMVKRRKLAQSL